MRRFVLSLALVTAPLASRADVPSVVTDFPVTGSLVAQVMGDLGQPVVLVEQGADVHDFQLKPSQAAAVAGADLVFWVGPGLTPWLGHMIERVGMDGHAVALLDAAGTHRMTFIEEGATGEDLAEKQEEHGETDPHAWLDPENAKLWLDAIATELGAVDAEHAAIYVENAERAKADIDALAAEVRMTLAPVGGAKVVLFHDAYAYFAAAYGLNIAGTVSESDAATPSAARIQEIHDILARAQAVCVFPEANHDPKYIATVTDGTGVKVGAALDPEGSAFDIGPGLYAALVKSLAANIAECVAK